MTNAENVREICRQIRGVALNYPAGMAEIVRQLEALGAIPVEGIVEMDPAVTSAFAGIQTRNFDLPEPEPEPEPVPVKRGPGRPPGTKNKPREVAP